MAAKDLQRYAKSCAVVEEPRETTAAINDDVIKLLLLRFLLANFGLLTNYLQELAPIFASAVLATLSFPELLTVVEPQQLIVPH